MKDKSLQVRDFILRNSWLRSCPFVRFLAAGEYNENYYLEDAQKRPFVFRINHGSQLNLKNQISYEYKVLQAVRASGITPEPYYYCEDAPALGSGAMLMQFCPGRHLNYQSDLERAARIFAKIHSLDSQEELVFQKDPIRDIAEESLALIQRFPQSHKKYERKKLLAYHESILELAEKKKKLFQAEKHCIVNTEVNSGNFLISPDNDWLIDWEKAVISSPSQDLGHFMVITTTRWKSDYILSEEEKLHFCRVYKEARSLDEDLFFIREKVRLLEKTILLRGLSWCFMAWHEYQKEERQLKNLDTAHRIEEYLSEIDQLLSTVD